MFYFLHGDPNKIFKKSQKMVEVLLNKKPNASLYKLNTDNFSEEILEELLGGQGLFENKYIVTISRLLENTQTYDLLISKVKEIAESENIFIWTEENVSKTDLKKIEKYAEKVESSEKKENKKEKMNIFDLAAALGEKDKKKAWFLYQKAQKDFSAEEIYGTLWWQIKSMLLAAQTNNAKEAGMKDYPYNKAKKYATNYGRGEIEDLAKKLVILYHNSRLRSSDLSLDLEKFILNY